MTDTDIALTPAIRAYLAAFDHWLQAPEEDADAALRHKQETLCALISGDPERLTYGSRYGDPLSPREIEILRLRATGRTAPAIACELIIAWSTVERHLDNLAAKLGTRHPALLALWAVHLGHVDPASVEQLGEMRWRR